MAQNLLTENNLIPR